MPLARVFSYNQLQSPCQPESQLSDPTRRFVQTTSEPMPTAWEF